MYQNNIFFYFFKVIFEINTSKQYKNTKIKLIHNKKKIKFIKNMISTAFQKSP